MKFLLVAVNAKYIHSNLAVFSLQAYARKQGHNAEVKEYTINQPKSYILKDIYLQKAHAVFFSCYIWNIDIIRYMIENLHKTAPDLHIFLGGPEVSFDAPKVLEEYPYLAGILKEEGEKTFTAVLESDWNNFKRGQIYESIPVLMDEIPFVYEQMDMDSLEHKIIYYESSRGCPFSCSYCLSSVDKRMRFRSLELVKRELQFFIDHEVPQVKFVDRTFNCKKEHAMEIWTYILEHDKGITNFHFEIAADLICEEQLALMAKMRPGLIQLEIGVQSTCEKTLEAIHRKTDFTKLSEVVHRIQDGKNIHQHLDLIAGLPYEDYERFCQSFNDVYNLKPDQLQLGFLKVLKGSLMYDQAAEYDCQYVSEPPYEVLSTSWVDFDHMIWLKAVDKMVDIYYNSGQYTESLPYLVERFPSPYDFFHALGSFYEACGYEYISHSRIRRYDILLEFATACNRGEWTCKQIDTEKLKFLMTMDLYLREKLKKAPAWAVDLSRDYDFDYEYRDLLTGNAKVTKKDSNLVKTFS